MRDLFSGEGGKKLLMIGAAAVMVLLLLSSLVRGGGSGSRAAEQTVPFEDAAEIEQTLESRLKALIEKIDGVGTVNVMVTLDGTSTRLYEKDEKTQTDHRSSGGGESNSTDNTANTARETETVLAGSAKEPLQTGILRPKVRGAVVVCSGAGDPIVKEKVTYTVAKALNIGISKVYVTD